MFLPFINNLLLPFISFSAANSFRPNRGLAVRPFQNSPKTSSNRTDVTTFLAIGFLEEPFFERATDSGESKHVDFIQVQTTIL